MANPTRGYRAEWTLQDRGLELMLGKTKFSDASDSLVLEDESARVQLRGAALNVGDLVTGLVVAVRGSAVPGGDFWATVSPSWDKHGFQRVQQGCCSVQ